MDLSHYTNKISKQKTEHVAGMINAHNVTTNVLHPFSPENLEDSTSCVARAHEGGKGWLGTKLCLYYLNHRSLQSRRVNNVSSHASKGKTVHVMTSDSAQCTTTTT